jgi:hypothetical protein
MSLFSIFSNQDAQNAADARTAGYNAGYSQLSDLYGQGRTATTNAYNNGQSTIAGIYAPVSGQANTGYGAYGDATGANGAAGNARALSNFQTGPGYQFQMQQGLQGIDRGAASRGMLSGGGTAAAEQNYGTGLANQSWNQYVTNLAPFGNQAVTSAYGQGSQQGALASGLGNQLGTSFQGQGQAANAAQQGIGNAQAAADLNNYNVSQAGLSAIGSVLGGVTGMGGFSGLGSMLGGASSGLSSMLGGGSPMSLNPGNYGGTGGALGGLY